MQEPRTIPAGKLQVGDGLHVGGGVYWDVRGLVRTKGKVEVELVGGHLKVYKPAEPVSVLIER